MDNASLRRGGEGISALAANSAVQQHVAAAVDLGGEIVGAAMVGVQFDH
jgi:hypothetical protein